MLMKDLSIIVRQMRVFSERKLQHRNIGFPEQVILMYLLRHENINQEQIGKFFEIDKGAIAKTMRKLEEKGLITRQENPENKREKRVFLTLEAKEIITEMQSILETWNQCVYKNISAEERAIFEKTLGIMAANSNDLLTREEKTHNGKA